MMIIVVYSKDSSNTLCADEVLDLIQVAKKIKLTCVFTSYVLNIEHAKKIDATYVVELEKISAKSPNYSKI